MCRESRDYDPRQPPGRPATTAGDTLSASTDTGETRGVRGPQSGEHDTHVLFGPKDREPDKNGKQQVESSQVGRIPCPPTGYLSGSSRVTGVATGLGRRSPLDTTDHTPLPRPGGFPHRPRCTSNRCSTQCHHRKKTSSGVRPSSGTHLRCPDSLPQKDLCGPMSRPRTVTNHRPRSPPFSIWSHDSRRGSPISCRVPSPNPGRVPECTTVDPSEDTSDSGGPSTLTVSVRHSTEDTTSTGTDWTRVVPGRSGTSKFTFRGETGCKRPAWYGNSPRTSIQPGDPFHRS